jgi:hypothetical protein
LWFDSVDGILAFVLILIPSWSGVILFIGDRELIPLFTSFPTSRKEMVEAKYISSFTIGILLIVFTYGIMWYLSFDFPNAQSYMLSLMSMKGLIFSLTPLTVIVSVSYPFLFRYGFSKGVRILLIGFVVLYSAGITAGERIIQAYYLVPRRGFFQAIMTVFEHMEVRFNNLVLYGMILLFLTVTLVVSIKVSVHWFSAKDIE